MSFHISPSVFFFALLLSRVFVFLTTSHLVVLVADVDNIIVLDEGRLTESGSHEMLKRQNGRYSDMWALQSGGQN